MPYNRWTTRRYLSVLFRNIKIFSRLTENSISFRNGDNFIYKKIEEEEGITTQLEILPI